jgi:signal transduction histidine kinase
MATCEELGIGRDEFLALALEAMKARVTEMGGTIAWEERAGGGTRVVVRFRTGDG